MKKILILIIIALASININAQMKYPSYFVKDGRIMGVIISVEQAQKIDNDYELLNLLINSKNDVSNLDSAYIVVIDNFGKKVAQLEVKISALEYSNRSKDAQLSNLRVQIEQYIADKKLSDEQLSKKDEIINNYKSENKKLKTQKFLGFTIGGGVLLATIVLLVINK